MDQLQRKAATTADSTEVGALAAQGDRVGETGDSTHEGWQQTRREAADATDLPAVTFGAA